MSQEGKQEEQQEGQQEGQQDNRAVMVVFEPGGAAEKMLGALVWCGATLWPLEDIPRQELPEGTELPDGPPVMPRLRAVPQTEEKPVFEGESFNAPNGFFYDSRAAWYITRWSHAVALHRPGTHQQEQFSLLMDDLLNEIQPANPTPVILANPGFDRAASVFMLRDGSRLISARYETDPDQDASRLFRLTGDVQQGNACWLDWGYDPPVASTAVPLPGNINPQRTSLEIG